MTIQLSNDSGVTWKPLAVFGAVLQPGHTNDMSAPLQPRSIKLTGQHGDYYFGSEIGGRVFTLPLVFPYELTRADLQQRLREFEGFLLIDGEPRELKLKFDYRPDVIYTVYVDGETGIERDYSLGFMTLNLVADDPFGYGPYAGNDVVRQYDTGLQYNTGLIYPNRFSFDWMYREQRVSMYHYGSMDTGIVITIAGTADNPSIEHEPSGNRLRLPSFTGTLIVDTGKMQVKRNGSSAPDVTGGFFDLLPGPNGLIFRADLVNASVSYTWNHRYR